MAKIDFDLISDTKSLRAWCKKLETMVEAYDKLVVVERQAQMELKSRISECASRIRAIKDVMVVLESSPMGGVGPDGPTLDELHAYVRDTGQNWADDACYHTAQTAWRLIEQLVQEKPNLR